MCRLRIESSMRYRSVAARSMVYRKTSWWDQSSEVGRNLVRSGWLTERSETRPMKFWK